MKFRKPLPPEFTALVEAMKQEGAATRCEEESARNRLIEAIRAEGRANRKEEQKEDRGKARRERITIAMLAATLVAVLWQVHEMMKVYEPIKQQADAAARAASAAAEESKSSQRTADAAVAQSMSAEKAFTLGQRAWVGPLNASIPSDPLLGASFESSIQYQNSGHEPATHFRWGIRFNSILEGKAWNKKAVDAFNNYAIACRNTKDYEATSPGISGIVYPSTGFSSNTLTTETSNLVDSEVVSGAKSVIVQGCFQYRTMDAPHYSLFCYYYRKGSSKPANLNLCTVGNEAN